MKSCITKGTWGTDGKWYAAGSDMLISCNENNHTTYHYKDSPSCQGSYTINVVDEYACTGGTTKFVCSASSAPWDDELDAHDYTALSK